MSIIARKNVSVCGWSPFKKYSRNASSMEKISIYEVMNMPTIISESSIN